MNLNTDTPILQHFYKRVFKISFRLLTTTGNLFCICASETENIDAKCTNFNNGRNSIKKSAATILVNV